MSIKKYLVSTAVLAAIFLFSFLLTNISVYAATANTATNGSILMNYDDDGADDPDCIGMPSPGVFIPWGDGFGSGSHPAVNKFVFCVNSAVKYASGLSNISNLKISYKLVPKLPAGPFPGESNGTYSTYQISYMPKTVAPAPVRDPLLSGVCTVSTSAITVGDSITWSVVATGGNNIYSYRWNGTDQLTSPNSSVTRRYNTPGTKTARVTISSGTPNTGLQHIDVNCSSVTVVAQVPPTPPTPPTPPAPPTPPTPNTSLTGSCSVSPSTVYVNNSVSWSVTGVSGGTGSYTYSWSGTDSLIGNNSSVSKTYSTTGTKTGTVIISSGSNSISRTCTAYVNSEIINNTDLSVSCSASQSYVDTDEDMTWRASVSGGNGSYTYDWSGTDGLDGSSRNLVWDYDDAGTKRATVTVWSAGDSDSASCTVRVDDNESDDDLSATCYVTPSNPQVGTRVNWYCNAYGGDGDYTYDWTGTDGLDSSSRSPYKTYDTAGTKRATVVIRDGNGNRISKSMLVNVKSVLSYTQEYQTPTYPIVYSDQSAVQPAAVYLSQVPYTGVADNYKLVIYLSILAAISAYIAYVVMSYKKNNA